MCMDEINKILSTDVHLSSFPTQSPHRHTQSQQDGVMIELAANTQFTTRAATAVYVANGDNG